MQGRHHIRARAWARLPFAGGALLLAAAILLPIPHAEAAPVGSLSMNPSNNSVEVGDTVTLTLDLGGLDIHRVQLGVTYNASVVQVVDAAAGTPGTQVLPGPFPGDETEGTVLQNIVSGGIINYQYELNGNSEVSGNGTVATVQFNAVANGNANLQWSTRIIADGNDATVTAPGAAAIIVVGIEPPPATATAQPTDTPQAAATNTAAATSTPAPTETAAATTTGTPGTATATRSATNTRTVTATRTVRAVYTPTTEAQITVLENSNDATPTPQGGTGTIGVDPSQPEVANGLPSAGNEGPGIEWWRWTFFAAALMLGVAGWFFTFALHYGDKEVVLVDRFDARRRRLGRKLPRR